MFFSFFLTQKTTVLVTMTSHRRPPTPQPNVPSFQSYFYVDNDNSYYQNEYNFINYSQQSFALLVVVVCLLYSFVFDMNQTTTNNDEIPYNNFHIFVERYIIPLYTIGVLIYLAIVYLKKEDEVWLTLVQQFQGGLKTTTTKVDVQQQPRISKDIHDTTVQPQGSPTIVPAISPVLHIPTTQDNDDTVVQKYESANPNAVMPINLSGSYKLKSNHNVDAFLEAQGVPWGLRRAALSATPTHHIQHIGNMITIKIEAVGFKTSTSYIINGSPIELDMRGRIFHDTMQYYYVDDDGDGGKGKENDNNAINRDNDDNINNQNPTNGSSIRRRCTGIIVTKKCFEENYVVTVKRELSEDQQTITMTSTATFAPETKKVPIVGQQIFTRVVT